MWTSGSVFWAFQKWRKTVWLKQRNWMMWVWVADEENRKVSGLFWGAVFSNFNLHVNHVSVTLNWLKWFGRSREFTFLRPSRWCWCQGSVDYTLKSKRLGLLCHCKDFGFTLSVVSELRLHPVRLTWAW